MAKAPSESHLVESGSSVPSSVERVEESSAATEDDEEDRSGRIEDALDVLRVAGRLNFGSEVSKVCDRQRGGEEGDLDETTVLAGDEERAGEACDGVLGDENEDREFLPGNH
jgi:hypothetical protein